MTNNTTNLHFAVGDIVTPVEDHHTMKDGRPQHYYRVNSITDYNPFGGERRPYYVFHHCRYGVSEYRTVEVAHQEFCLLDLANCKPLEPTLVDIKLRDFAEMAMKKNFFGRVDYDRQEARLYCPESVDFKDAFHKLCEEFGATKIVNRSYQTKVENITIGISAYQKWSYGCGDMRYIWVWVREDSYE